MEIEENNDWGKSVAGIVIKENKVLLTRHTYGGGKGKLIIPGGYIKKNETPQEAVKREIHEETGITVEPMDIVGIRFNLNDWYVVFTAQYISGTETSDNSENSEVVWLDMYEVITREDVPDLTKKLVEGVINNKNKAFKKVPYSGTGENGTYSLYGLS